jgi:hypothetical protein
VLERAPLAQDPLSVDPFETLSTLEIPPNQDPKREVTRDLIFSFLQNIQYLQALSDTGATIQSHLTSNINIPASKVLRTIVNINDQDYSALLDTGASLSAVNPDILPQITQDLV